MILDLEQFTLAEKLAQLLFVRIGSNLPPISTASEDEARVARLLDECPIGGLLLFKGEWPAARGTLERLQAKSKTPLLVASDLERGAAQQLAGLTAFPHARAFAELGEDADASLRRAAAITAGEALEAGVHVVFAPVADANTNPNNPIIATRAYGEDPAAVAKLVAAVVESTLAAGALPTAKHFPGHGDTSQDSHAELPSVQRTAEQLHASELVPFRAAIAAGAPLVMTAHVSYPALDPTGAPATFSRPILTDLLRGELGFEGVVCSDSLLMAGARDLFENEGQMAAAAILAGVDLLLDVADPAAVVRFLEGEVERGALPLGRVDEAAGRVLKLKQVTDRPAHSPRLTSDESLSISGRFAATVARGAIGWRAAAGSRPEWRLSPDRPVTAVLFKPFQLATDPPEQPLANALRKLAPLSRYFEFNTKIDPAVAQQALAAANDSEQVLLAIIAKPAAWHAFGMTTEQQELADQLAEHPGALIASLGVPTILERFPAGRPKVCTFSDIPASQQALVDFLSSTAG